MSKTRPEWSQEITKRADDLVALRRDFHRHPELSHQERRTAEIIAERLHAAKLDVRAGVDELVAVWRATAEEPAFDRGLGSHRGADAGLDPHPLALAHAAVERHHHVVGFGAGVDRAADFGHPQPDAVVGEHGEGETELVAVERTLGLTDHDGIEPALRITERFE